MDTAIKNLNEQHDAYVNGQTENIEMPNTPSGNASGLATENKTSNQTNQTNQRQEIPKRKKKPLTGSEKFLRFIDKYFMLLCLSILIPLTTQYPIGNSDGPLNPQLTSSWIVTIILFFSIGLGTKLIYLKRACAQKVWQMNIFCHTIIFVYFPIIGWSIYELAQLSPFTISKPMNALLEGIIILCTLPATAASAVVFTTNASGNEVAAAINCTMSQLLGIFITPVLILIFMGNKGHTDIDAADIFTKLSLRVITPFFGAQIIRLIIGPNGKRKLKNLRPYIKKMNELCLLYIVFCALSETFYSGIKASVVEIFIFLLIIECLHCHAYFIIYFFSSVFRCCLMNKTKSLFMAFTMCDRIACIYSGVSKTIALGIPLIEIIYGNNSNIGMYILPILCYHPSNLIIGSLMVEPLKRLALKERNFMSTFTYDASGFTDLTHGTDYGAISPFKIDHIADNTFIFAPFTPLPDEPEEYESVSNNEQSINQSRDNINT